MTMAVWNNHGAKRRDSHFLYNEIKLSEVATYKTIT